MKHYTLNQKAAIVGGIIGAVFAAWYAYHSTQSPALWYIIGCLSGWVARLQFDGAK